MQQRFESESGRSSRRGKGARGERFLRLGVQLSVSSSLAIVGLTATNGASTLAAAAPAGSLTVLETPVTGTWSSLDPATNTETAADVNQMGAIYGELFQYGPQGKMLPDLATGYKFTNGGLTFEITLRKGVDFSDGTAFNASAVAYNIKRDLEPSFACICKTVFPLKSVTTKGNYTVDLNLQRVYQPIVTAFYGEAPNYIASPAALKRMGEKAFALKPVGAGPFVVTKDVAGSTLRLQANRKYWQKGEPLLQSLTFTTVGNDQSAYSALVAGNAQAYQGYTSYSSLKTLSKSVKAVSVPPFLSTDVIQLDTVKSPFNNLKAREAIYYATDPQAINKALYAGRATVVESATEPTGLYYEPSVPGYRKYNLAKAKALVGQMGGLSVTLTTGSGGTNQELGEALESQWAQAGIKTTLSQVDITTAIKEFQTHDWQATVQNLAGLSPALLLNLPARWESTGFSTGVQDKHLDTLIAKAAGSLSPNAQRAAYRAVFKYISDMAYSPFIVAPPAYNLVRPGVSGPGLTTNDAEVLWQSVKVAG